MPRRPVLRLDPVGVLPAPVQSSTGSTSDNEDWHLRHHQLADQARRLLAFESSRDVKEKIFIDEHSASPRFVLTDSNSGGFLCAWVVDNGKDGDPSWALPAEFVRLNVGPGLRKVKFLPEEAGSQQQLPRTFAYLYEDYDRRTTVAIKDRLLNNETQLSLGMAREALATNVDLGRERLGHQACRGRVIDFTWWMVNEEIFLAVVSTIAVHLLSYGTVYKQLQQVDVPDGVSNVWFDHSSPYVLVETTAGKLLPWRLVQRQLQALEPLELQLLAWQRVQRADLCLMQLYDTMYCIHCDNANGRITLRSVDGNRPFDFVVSVPGPGTLVLQRQDNLLLVHRPDRAETRIVDIRQASGEVALSPEDQRLVAIVRELAPPVRLSAEGCTALPSARQLDDAQYPRAWRFAQDGWLVDGDQRAVWRVAVDVEVALAAAVPSGAPPADAVRWLLRRRYGSEQLLAVATDAAKAEDPTMWTACAMLLGRACGQKCKGNRKRSRNDVDCALTESQLVRLILKVPTAKQRKRLVVTLLESLLRSRILPGPVLTDLIISLGDQGLVKALIASRVIRPSTASLESLPQTDWSQQWQLDPK